MTSKQRKKVRVRKNRGNCEEKKFLNDLLDFVLFLPRIGTEHNKEEKVEEKKLYFLFLSLYCKQTLRFHGGLYIQQ